MHRISIFFLTALFLTAMLLQTPAAADAPNDTLTDTDISRRIDWIQSSLDAGGASAKRWQYGWSTAYGGLTYLYAGQSLVLDDDDQSDDRYDALVNSAGSLIGLVGTLAFPMKTHIAAESLKRMPEVTQAQKEAKLQQAETLLRQSAEREAQGRCWQAHAFGALVSALAGVAVASDDGRSEDGLIMFATNLLVSEIQIFTTPTRATTDWKRYRQGRPGQSIKPKAKSRFSISLLPRGIAANYLF
ncbi:MAG: hypothetical protein PVI89_00565 [Desulfobacteraceae bacterium]|jgi:hypothetical protein